MRGRSTGRPVPRPCSACQSGPVLYEIRRYTCVPGGRDEWVAFMADVILPFQVSLGITVVATFTDVADPDGYIWIRGFADEAHRTEMYAAVYGSERWKNEMAGVGERLLIRSEIVSWVVAPTPASPLS